MEVRRATLFAMFVASCGGATVAHVPPAGEARMTPASDAAGAWPQQLDPRWPAGCLIENAAVHPREPWIDAPHVSLPVGALEGLSAIDGALGAG